MLIDPNEFTVQLYVSRADPSKININFDLPAGASIAPVKQLAEDGDKLLIISKMKITLENLRLHQKIATFLLPIQSDFGKQKCLSHTTSKR